MEKEKWIYAYRNLKGKKDRKTGVRKLSQFYWENIESLSKVKGKKEGRQDYIMANWLEVLLYKAGLPLLSSWSSLSTTQKINVIAIIVAVVIFALGVIF